jgi:hypothetical protein
MGKIEIRQNKKTLIPMLVVLALSFGAITYFTFFWSKAGADFRITIMYFISLALFLYAFYFPKKN